MTREQALEWLHDPTGAEPDPATRRELAAWIEQDDELREIQRQQQSLHALLDEWNAPEPSATFDEELFARIAEQERSPAGRMARLRDFFQPQPWWAAAAVAAVLALAVSLPRADEPATSAAVEKASVEIEQGDYYEALDQALDDVDMLLDFEAFVPAPEENRS